MNHTKSKTPKGVGISLATEYACFSASEMDSLSDHLQKSGYYLAKIITPHIEGVFEYGSTQYTVLFRGRYFENDNGQTVIHTAIVPNLVDIIDISKDIYFGMRHRFFIKELETLLFAKTKTELVNKIRYEYPDELI